MAGKGGSEGVGAAGADPLRKGSESRSGPSCRLALWDALLVLAGLEGPCPLVPLPIPTPAMRDLSTWSGARLRKRSWGRGEPGCTVLGQDVPHASSGSLAHCQPEPPFPSAHGHAVL